MERDYLLGLGHKWIPIEAFKNALIGSETIQDVGIPFTLDQLHNQCQIIEKFISNILITRSLFLLLQAFLDLRC